MSFYNGGDNTNNWQQRYEQRLPLQDFMHNENYQFYDENATLGRVTTHSESSSTQHTHGFSPNYQQDHGAMLPSSDRYAPPPSDSRLASMNALPGSAHRHSSSNPTSTPNFHHSQNYPNRHHYDGNNMTMTPTKIPTVSNYHPHYRMNANDEPYSPNNMQLPSFPGRQPPSDMNRQPFMMQGSNQEFHYESRQPRSQGNPNNNPNYYNMKHHYNTMSPGNNMRQNPNMMHPPHPGPPPYAHPADSPPDISNMYRMNGSRRHNPQHELEVVTPDRNFDFANISNRGYPPVPPHGPHSMYAQASERKRSRAEYELSRTISKGSLSEEEGEKEQVENPPVICRCVKSRCLKLYCDCFQTGALCNTSCKCVKCLNTQSQNKPGGRLKMAKRDYLLRKPGSFGKKEKKSGEGCSCKNNRCLKKYCNCFRNSISCSIKCFCVDCANHLGINKQKSVADDP